MVVYPGWYSREAYPGIYREAYTGRHIHPREPGSLCAEASFASLGPLRRGFPGSLGRRKDLCAEASRTP